MSSSFPDHFSAVADAYADFRPRYPDALFDWLAAAVDSRRLALDVATGNGQAVAGLVDRFERVLASDASAGQLARMPAWANVETRCEPAEQLSAADDSVDLLTVAQALHWFDHPRFFAEVWRVLRPGGLIAAWCYQHSPATMPRSIWCWRLTITMWLAPTGHRSGPGSNRAMPRWTGRLPSCRHPHSRWRPTGAAPSCSVTWAAGLPPVWPGKRPAAIRAQRSSRRWNGYGRTTKRAACAGR